MCETEREGVGGERAVFMREREREQTCFVCAIGIENSHLKPKLHIYACIAQTMQITLFRLCSSNKCDSVHFFDVILFLTWPLFSKGT